MSTDDKITLRLEQAATFGNGDVGGVLHWADDRAYLYRMPAAAWSALEAAIAAHAELEAARPVVEAAVAYENRWRRYAGVQPGADSIEVRLAKAEAHQALLNAVRVAAVDLYRSATSDHPSTTEEKP